MPAPRKSSRKPRLAGKPERDGPLRSFRGVERRALDAAEPGAIIIFDGKPKKEKSIELVYKAPLAFDSDVRKLIRYVQIRAAQHFRASLLRQEEANGMRKLPPPKSAKDTNKLWGIESGRLAEFWRLQRVTGSSVKASGKVKTSNAYPGNILFVTRANSLGIELVSAKGKASTAIAQAFREWMTACFGNGVATPREMRYQIEQRLNEAEGKVL